MKKIFAIMMCVSLAFLTACSGFKEWWHSVITDETSLNRICATIEGTSKTGSILLVSKVPEAKDPMLIVVNSIEVLGQTEEGVKPDVIEAAIKKALDGTSCSESVKQSILAVTDSVLVFYKAVYIANIETQYTDVTRGYIKMVNSMCKGIREGCGAFDLAGNPEVKAYIPIECYTKEQLIFTR